MLAQIRNSSWFRITNLILIAGGLCALTSCATKQDPPLISDNTGPESALPWNKQEKWEGTGQLGGMAERFQGR